MDQKVKVLTAKQNAPKVRLGGRPLVKSTADAALGGCIHMTRDHSHGGGGIGDPNQVSESSGLEHDALLRHPGGKGELSRSNVEDLNALSHARSRILHFHITAVHCRRLRVLLRQPGELGRIHPGEEGAGVGGHLRLGSGPLAHAHAHGVGRDLVRQLCVGLGDHVIIDRHGLRPVEGEHVVAPLLRDADEGVGPSAREEPNSTGADGVDCGMPRHTSGRGQNHLHHTLNHVAPLIRAVMPVEVADGPMALVDHRRHSHGGLAGCPSAWLVHKKTQGLRANCIRRAIEHLIQLLVIHLVVGQVVLEAIALHSRRGKCTARFLI